MLLLLKNTPVLEIKDNGNCKILDFDYLPLALRKEDVSFADFFEWASNRTLSIGRSYAKEILNSLRLSQNNRFAVCRACRGLSLEDSYWIRQENDSKTWEEVNLFHNPLSLFITEISLSGTNTNYHLDTNLKQTIHTPELTTLGASAKGWVRHEDGLHLHKVGKYEIPAHEILEALKIEHIPETNYTTVGGLIFEKSEELCDVNDVITINTIDEQIDEHGNFISKPISLVFTILAIESKKITQAKLEIIEESPVISNDEE